MLTPTERSIRSTVGAHISWANTENRTARTEPGRRAFNDRFLTEVDPEGVLPEAERAKRAANARKAYFAQLALKSAKSRRRAKEARAEAAMLEQVADDADAELSPQACSHKGAPPPGDAPTVEPGENTAPAQDRKTVVQSHLAEVDGGAA